LEGGDPEEDEEVHGAFEAGLGEAEDHEEGVWSNESMIMFGK
jgi:hypothetical protein